jgi:hypothetical protein
MRRSPYLHGTTRVTPGSSAAVTGHPSPRRCTTAPWRGGGRRDSGRHPMPGCLWSRQRLHRWRATTRARSRFDHTPGLLGQPASLTPTPDAVSGPTRPHRAPRPRGRGRGADRWLQHFVRSDLTGHGRALAHETPADTAGRGTGEAWIDGRAGSRPACGPNKPRSAFADGAK